MFAKPFNLMLIYILSIINLLIIFLPIIFSISPLFFISEKEFLDGIKDSLYISFFLISSFMFCYLILDYILGFTIWGLTRKSKLASKYAKKHDFILEIIDNFNLLQHKFKTKNVKLLISDSDEINAYAIGSLRKKVVVLTLGLIGHFRKNSQNEAEFQHSIKAILGHEISHLVNKDYLPTLLLFASEKATNLLLSIINLFFRIITRIFGSIPFIGALIYNLIHSIHNLIYFIINFFHRYIILNIFEFLKLYVSRTTEYRCDYQAAQACGGGNMALALSFFGESGFITIFSTHPRTKSRIKYIKNVKQSLGHIRVSFINKVSNFLSIFLLVIILGTSFNYVKKIEYLQINPHLIGFNFYKYQNIINKYKYDIQQKLSSFF